jgi:hypothetical protein
MNQLDGISSPLSWKATKLTTYPSGGASSRWSDGGTLHSGWLWLALDHGPTPPVSSLSLRNEPTCLQEGSGSFLPWLSRTACGGDRGRGDDGGEERLKGAQGKKGGQTQMAYGGHTEPWAPYLYPNGRPMGGTGKKVGTVPAFNVLI